MGGGTPCSVRGCVTVPLSHHVEHPSEHLGRPHRYACRSRQSSASQPLRIWSIRVLLGSGAPVRLASRRSPVTAESGRASDTAASPHSRGLSVPCTGTWESSWAIVVSYLNE